MVGLVAVSCHTRLNHLTCLVGEDDIQHDHIIIIFFIIWVGEFVRSIIANRMLPKGWPYKGGWGKTYPESFFGWNRIEKLFNPLYAILKTRYPTVKHFHSTSLFD